ncbi:MAG: TadE/TadG family type IV pilus assembly protein [Qipengyuania sp.]
MVKFAHCLKRLQGCTSGNAMMLFALGAPMLMGGAGFAVDTAQWYLWQRELQHAVDQAAIAAAWARTEPAAANSYQTRGAQEYNANLALLSGVATNPTIKLVNYGTGTNNSVTVSASATRSLPFSQLIMGNSVTVSASAQATFEAQTNYSTCLLALDPTGSNSFILGGTASGNVTCGFGAISTASSAMKKNGNTTAQGGYLVAGGGIDSGFASNGAINDYVANLKDPYAGLTPPTSATGRTYSCPTNSGGTGGTSTADVTTTTTITYSYWQGKNQNDADTQVTYSGGKSGSTSSSTQTGKSVSSSSSNGVQSSTTQNQWTGESWPVAGSRNDEIYEKKTTTTQVTYSNVQHPTGTAPNTTAMMPGTYANIEITCDTHFSPGVYVVTGNLDLGKGSKVTGSDVMFVITGSGTEKVHLNADSNVALSGISAATLQNNYGLSAEAAAKLNGMLIYDPVSTAPFRLNGSASLGLNGIVYAPKRDGKFNGNSTIGGSCMILALKTMEFTGTNDLNSFCLPTGVGGIDIGGTTAQVRLVA